MITISEWKAMSGKEQTLWLELNTILNGISRSQRGLVYGIGVNDAPYQTGPRIYGNQVVCPAYGAWKNMLKRAYSENYLVKHQTYSGVKVCDEWHMFSAFRIWWLQNHVDGCNIDKDLLGDSRVYSPEASLFVPTWLNTFTVDSGAIRGEHPIGVNFNIRSGKFVSKCRNPISRKREYLGHFTTPEEAHLAWLNRKLELALELKPRMDEIDLRIYPRVIEIINNAK